MPRFGVTLIGSWPAFRRASLLLLLVVTVNVGFVGFSVLAREVDEELFRGKIRNAFQAGELLSTEARRFDRAVGWDLFSDCVVLHMLFRRSSSVLLDVVAPPLFLEVGQEPNWPQCRLLLRDVKGEITRTCRYAELEEMPECQMAAFPYARYWHGNRSLAAVLLSVLDLRELRMLYKAASYLGLVVLGIVVLLQVPRLWAVLLPVPAVGMASLGVAYYGQSLVHAVPYLVLIFGLIGLTVFRVCLSVGERLLYVSAALGCLCTYFEFWNGAIPVGAALLPFWVYFVYDGLEARAGSLGERKLLALWCLLVFLAAVALTVAIKLALAGLLLGSEPIVRFMDRFLLRVDGEGYTVATTVGALVSYRAILGNGSPIVGAVVALSGVLAWCGGLAVVLAELRSRPLREVALRHRNYLVAGAAASVVIGWLMFFRNHTSVHAYFMVRTLFVPIALGYSGLALAVRDSSLRKKLDAP